MPDALERFENEMERVIGPDWRDKSVDELEEALVGDAARLEAEAVVYRELSHFAEAIARRMRERDASTATEVVDEVVAQCYGGWSLDVEWLWSRLGKGKNHES
jgi:hypothetical protein